MSKEEKVKELIERLSKIWPEPKSELRHSNALELLVATILSAQTTDKLVNTITPILFAKFKSAEDYANASIQEIDEIIMKVTYHSSKASYLKRTGELLVKNFDGEVPDTIEELVTLPGVARKTANVVLGDVFNKQEGIAVDTHVRRLSQHLGLTEHTDPVKIERDLMAIVPRKDWTRFSHLLILYGRYYCTARKQCSECEEIADLCEK